MLRPAHAPAQFPCWPVAFLNRTQVMHKANHSVSGGARFWETSKHDVELHLFNELLFILSFHCFKVGCLFPWWLHVMVAPGSCPQ